MLSGNGARGHQAAGEGNGILPVLLADGGLKIGFDLVVGNNGGFGGSAMANDRQSEAQASIGVPFIGCSNPITFLLIRMEQEEIWLVFLFSPLPFYPGRRI
jgi:hypothetical protein